MLAVGLLTSCKQQFAFVYNANLEGDVDGKVNVEWKGGSLYSNGTAALDFEWTNDTSKLKVVMPMNLQEAYRTNADVAKEIESYLESFEIVSEQLDSAQAEGSYKLHVYGYIGEQATGIRVPFDYEFTNR